MNAFPWLIGRLIRKKSVWTRGEDAAARHMRKSGSRIVTRNLRMSMGEIDLVCEDPKTGAIIVVEVKARQRHARDTRRIDPEANITAAKKAKLRTLAKALAKREAYRDRPIRIDVIAVVFEEGSRNPIELRHYQSAV